MNTALKKMNKEIIASEKRRRNREGEKQGTVATDVRTFKERLMTVQGL